jgi:hypothetical protein
MKPVLLAALLAMAAAAQAQQQAYPQRLAPAAPPPPALFDALPTPMLAMPDDGADFRRWYARNQRPAIVIYVSRQLDQAQAGWRGTERLLIEDVGHDGARQMGRSISVGQQRHSAADAMPKTSLDKLFEQAIARALRRQDVKVLDGAYLQRKLAADPRARDTDVEYASLSRAARFVLEVEFLCVQQQCDIVGTFKDVRNGEVGASARQPMGAVNDADDVDKLSKALVMRLLRERPAG